MVILEAAVWSALVDYKWGEETQVQQDNKLYPPKYPYGWINTLFDKKTEHDNMIVRAGFAAGRLHWFVVSDSWVQI